MLENSSTINVVVYWTADPIVFRSNYLTLIEQCSFFRQRISILLQHYILAVFLYTKPLFVADQWTVLIQYIPLLHMC